MERAVLALEEGCRRQDAATQVTAAKQARVELAQYLDVAAHAYTNQVPMAARQAAAGPARICIVCDYYRVPSMLRACTPCLL